jgi:hypothetical protein
VIALVSASSPLNWAHRALVPSIEVGNSPAGLVRKGVLTQATNHRWHRLCVSSVRSEGARQGRASSVDVLGLGAVPSEAPPRGAA